MDLQGIQTQAARQSGDAIARRSAALGAVVGRRAVRPQSVLLVASLGVFMAFVDATVVTIAFPDIARSFPATGIDGLSWVLNAYNIVFAAFLVAAGRAADLLGRKRVFESGLVLFTLASAACALAPSAGLLIAARVVQALGAAIVVPASLALVMQAFEARERTRAVALWAASAALAAGLGPSVGGVLVNVADWRAAFLVNLPIGLLAMLASRRWLVESRAPGKRTLPDAGGAVMFGAAVSALVLGVVKGPDWGWGDGRVVGAFAAACLLASAFVRRSARHPAPLIDPALVRIRTFAVANALMLAAAAAYFALILNNVLFLTTVWEWSVLEAGLAMTPGPIVAAAVAGPVGRHAERIDTRVLILVGAAFWASGAIGYLTLAGQEPDFLTGWLPATIVAGVGGGITFPTLSAVAVAAAPGERFATATALNSVSRQLGSAIGVAVLVALLGAQATVLDDFQRGWLLAVGLFAALAAGAVALGRVPAAPAEPAADGPEARPSAVLGRAAAPTNAACARGAPVLPTLNGSGSLASFLRAVPMLADAPPDSLARLARSATIVRLRGGEVLFREGEQGDSLFLVGSGRLEAVRGTGGDEDILRTLRPGDVLGELAVLTGGRRAATVRARRDTVLVRVERDGFRAVLHETPELAISVANDLAGKVRDSRPAVSHQRTVATTFAVVALGPEEDAARFASDLRRALSGFGRAALVTAAVDVEATDLAELVDAHERHHDYVVLSAGRPEEHGRWQEFCLRHADRVLAAITDAHVPDWVYWHPRLRGCDLVYFDRGRGRGVAEWSRALHPRARFRVAVGDDWRAGVEAAARRIAGRSVGVVLSGGGARGFAHIGVLEELVAAGVVIDRVGGVSCGSWIGGMFALGMSPEEIDARCYEEWVRRNPLNDYTLPRTSMIRGHRVRTLFERNLPGLIEDMPLDYYCVSSDLVAGELVVHREGRLAVAAAASQCLPGLAPPVALDGRLLVDGGLMNNLPVDVMAATGEGPVVAVDVTARYRPPAPDRRRRGPRRDDPGPWNDDVPRPSVLETISRAVVLGSVDTEAAARRFADVVIQPIEEDVGMLEWHQLDRVRERGRRAARDVLAETPAALLGLG